MTLIAVLLIAVLIVLLLNVSRGQNADAPGDLSEPAPNAEDTDDILNAAGRFSRLCAALTASPGYRPGPNADTLCAMLRWDDCTCRGIAFFSLRAECSLYAAAKRTGLKHERLCFSKDLRTVSCRYTIPQAPKDWMFLDPEAVPAGAAAFSCSVAPLVQALCSALPGALAEEADSIFIYDESLKAYSATISIRIRL